MALKFLNPKQRETIRASTSRLNIWHGSVRSGKTVATEIRWLQRMLHGPPGDAVMVGKTERTLKRNVLTPMQRMLGLGRMQILSGTGEARILGRTVYLVGANDERASQKILGGTFSDAYGDELTLWPESFFKVLLSRLSVPGAALFGTTNPDGPFHWLKRDYLDAGLEHLRAFHFVLEDNHTLDPAFVAALKREYTGLWYKRMILGLWVLAEGAIWDSFDEGVHLVERVPDGVKMRAVWSSLDYGTSAPFVTLLFGEGDDGIVYVLDEWRWDSKAKGRQLSDSEYASIVVPWANAHEHRPEIWYPDPSATSFIVQLRQDGCSVRPADNDVEDGLRTVSSFLAQRKLRILRRCDGLIGEIQSYVWDPKQQDRGLDVPLDQNDHGPDALLYGIRSRYHGRHAGLLAYARERVLQEAAGA